MRLTTLFNRPPSNHVELAHKAIERACLPGDFVTSILKTMGRCRLISERQVNCPIGFAGCLCFKLMGTKKFAEGKPDITKHLDKTKLNIPH
jgi:hypothetical protein